MRSFGSSPFLIPRLPSIFRCRAPRKWGDERSAKARSSKCHAKSNKPRSSPSPGRPRFHFTAGSPSTIKYPACRISERPVASRRCGTISLRMQRVSNTSCRRSADSTTQSHAARRDVTIVRHAKPRPLACSTIRSRRILSFGIRTPQPPRLDQLFDFQRNAPAGNRTQI